MATILVFFCLIANWPFWPCSRSNILLNFTFESEAKWAKLQSNKRILKWWPFWSKVYFNEEKETETCLLYGFLVAVKEVITSGTREPISSKNSSIMSIILMVMN